MSTLLHRYWLFAGARHYAGGGMHDLHATYPTLDEATAVGAALKDDDNQSWWHVSDAHTGTILAASDPQAYDVVWPPTEVGDDTPQEGT